MKIKITSHRGHHECAVDATVGEALFDKLTGRRVEALPAELRPKIPENFAELEGLWRDSRMNYAAVATRGGELVGVREFAPQADEIVFIAPITGG